MSTFARKFPLTSLETQPPAWWTTLLKLWAPSGSECKDGLRFAVRKNSCNFYILGQSVGRITHNQQRNPRLSVSKMYVEGAVSSSNANVEYCAEAVPNIASMIALAQKKSDKEKAFVDLLVSRNIDVIDLEMGLPASYLGRKSSLRIDLVSLERRDDKIFLVFWEVKLINDGRLVSQTRPEVLRQMDDYKDFLREAGGDVMAGYRESCAILAAVHNAAKALRPEIAPLSGLISEVLANPSLLAIDGDPRLLVFGEADVRMRGHLAKLAREVPLLHMESEAASLQLRCVAVEGS